MAVLKTSRLGWLLCIFIFLAQPTFSQSKWEKQLIKVDTEFKEGDYEKANKLLAKFKKKVTKKLGVSNEYMAQYYLRSAKFNIAAGLLIDIDPTIEKALEISTQINGESSQQHALNQLDVADILLLYGNFVEASNYVDRAETTLENANELSDNIKAKIDLKRAQILTGQGYYNEALSFIDSQLNYFRGRAVFKESYVDESGKLKTRRLTEDEVIDRMSDYATLLTTKANAFRKKGVYKSADSAFTRAEEWISSNMDDSSIEYVQNQYLHGKFLVENGLLEFSGATKNARFDRTLSKLKKQHEESHYLAFELYETLLKWYLNQDQRAKYRSAKVEYEKAIKRNFKKTSLHNINLETIEFDSDLSKGKTGKIESKANQILASTRSLPKHHAKTMELYDVLYRVSLQKQNFIIAEKYLTDIIEIKKVLYGEESPEYHLSKVELANYYIDHTDKIKEAQQIYEESFFAVVDQQIDDWHKDYVNILNHIALFYQTTDQYQKASDILAKAENTARAKFRDTDPNYGVQLNKLAKLYIDIGNYDEAEENIDASIVILENERRNEKRVLDYVDALQTKARLKAIQGLFDEAESTINMSQKLQTRAETSSTFNELKAAEELASLYITLGQYRDTEELIDKQINTYESRYGINSQRLIKPLVNRGRLQLISGEYPEAEKTALRARNIAVNIFGDNSSKVAPTVLLLSEVYTNIGDYEKAESNAKKAVNIQKKQFGTDHIDVGQSIAQLALIKFYKGDDLKEVEQLMDQAKDITASKLGNRNPRYARILTDLAKVYISQHRYDDAFNGLKLAESIWISKVGRRNNINTASIYVLEGDIYYLQRQFDLAEESYEKAERLYKKFFSNTHPEYVKVQSKLSKVYYMEGDSKRAKEYIEEALANYHNFIKNYFPALSEREKAKYWNTIRPDFEFYNTLAFELNDSDDDMAGKVYNNALITKAILLNSSIKIRERITNSNDADLIEKYNMWLDKKEQLTNVLSMSLQQLEENGIVPSVLTHEVEQLEKEISERSELFSQASEDKRILWEDVQKVLKPNEVAIEMVRYRHFDHVFTDSVVYAALYLKNKETQKKPQVTFIDNGEELEGKYFQNYRNSIIFKITDGLSYDTYWQPLKEVVGNYATIYLSADGVYNQINLEAIPTPDGKYVIDNSNIILVSNTKDIYLNQVRTQLVQDEKVATMFGNPNFYLTASRGAIQSLPGTAREVSELKDLLSDRGWNISAYTESEAQEEQIKKLDNPKVFHVATHGFFTPEDEHDISDQVAMSESEAARNPLLRTGLLMTGAGDLLDKSAFNYNIENGILTAYEAMNLNLDQTELVVLSACETGLGELAVGEGVYGLQRAFLVAGAQTLIMSMFKVDDEATQKLMSKFYKKWIETGNKRQSFIDAKKEIRAEYQEPIYWGAFIMIGLD
ncbi:CHAT domain-containing protein [Fulvivirga sp. RKSG066]|uniref:CHAT domain-containing protein n=1 Tax=Fulvivirga aurantia TaxID=2529383 RepID=UPI0012BC5B63|nr:CHAT domain-containing protein [Fulvivirga aurantia]MTI22990.1 CHAT domain-containing protein [Fulvivirga aurantia]